PIEDVSLAIGRQWKVGQQGKPGDPARNTGVIILVVPKETSKDGRGHVRTEVGYGAEGFITDATTRQFRAEALPFFMRQDYGHGIELMTLRVAQRFADEFHFQIDSTFQAPVPPRQAARRGRSSGGGLPPFVWAILFFVIVSLVSGRRRGGCIPIFFPIGGWGG